MIYYDRNKLNFKRYTCQIMHKNIRSKFFKNKKDRGCKSVQ